MTYQLRARLRGAPPSEGNRQRHPCLEIRMDRGILRRCPRYRSCNLKAPEASAICGSRQHHRHPQVAAARLLPSKLREVVDRVRDLRAINLGSCSKSKRGRRKAGASSPPPQACVSSAGRVKRARHASLPSPLSRPPLTFPQQHTNMSELLRVAAAIPRLTAFQQATQAADSLAARKEEARTAPEER